MIYIYDKSNGYIINAVDSAELTIEDFERLHQSLKLNYGVIEDEKFYSSIDSRVVDGKFVVYEGEDKEDWRRFKRIRTAEERQKEKDEIKELEIQKKLVPTRDEILKAEVKLEIIEAFSESGVLKNE